MHSATIHFFVHENNIIFHIHYNYVILIITTNTCSFSYSVIIITCGKVYLKCWLQPFRSESYSQHCRRTLSLLTLIQPGNWTNTIKVKCNFSRLSSFIVGIVWLAE